MGATKAAALLRAFQGEEMSLFAELFDVDAEVTGTAVRKQFRPQRDTIEDARRKIVENIDANIAHLQGRTPSKRPNRLFRRLPSGRYEVGAKYGNTWMKDWIVANGTVLTYVHVREENLINTLELIKAAVLRTEADEEIEEIMARNVAMHAPKL